ncbi:Hypothetical predicted protein [Octopus vulgaris]|uniref:Uncharacterized protein n=1 Tax=Octopus vulgaris TaxID=6645 RepID=A0AA36BE98_OCTVU|nr:Hypothetical predicted protein [Octopus vulgaris]
MVNYIKSRPLKRCLLDMDSQHKRLPLHTKVTWLSKAANIKNLSFQIGHKIYLVIIKPFWQSNSNLLILSYTANASHNFAYIL